MYKNTRGYLKAFTLMELMIAVTIFSIIAVSVYSVFNTGIRMWRKTNPIIDSNQAMRIFFNDFSLDLKNSLAYTKEGINFIGEPNRLSLMTLIEVSGNGIPFHTELARVVYYYDTGTKSIRRLVATKDQGFDETKALSTESLKLAGGQNFGFEYCYKAPYPGDSGYTYKWKDTWGDQSKIPRGVRMMVGEFRKTVFIPTGELGVEQ